jgi:hypothetical protein
MAYKLMQSGQPANYNETPATRANGDPSAFEVDAVGNLKTTLATALDRVNDDIEAYIAKGSYVNLTASGQILAGPGVILGYRVNTTDAGTVRISDALTATTPYLGAAATPAVGWHEYPVKLATGGYVTIGGTALDVTFLVIAD